MAIEIKELHVRLFMGNNTAPDSADPANNLVAPCSDLAQQEQLVNETAQEVLRILKAQERR
ncbi:MAG TPA: hypothetical protein ENJ82_04785 [Bacteroidetes bacterium]|nr:hypothetical protein [Bacteroidota bacterium]